ncbi:hypothetical protein AADZ90_012850 [Aestuariibius sp. 2305UL40-4]|uniref:DUF7742 family protein n=1 Tax=Aestuariibius violaceus TaxID=3234132 RepID=UPI00345F04C4
MRAVLSVDIDFAARAALMVPPDKRAALVYALCERAHIADRIRKKTGRASAGLGDGTLTAAAAQVVLAPRSPRYDIAWCDALEDVLTGLAAWRRDQSCLTRGCSPDSAEPKDHSPAG